MPMTTTGEATRLAAQSLGWIARRSTASTQPTQLGLHGCIKMGAGVRLRTTDSAQFHCSPLNFAERSMRYFERRRLFNARHIHPSEGDRGIACL